MADHQPDHFEAYLAACRLARLNRHFAKHHPTVAGGNRPSFEAAALYWERRASHHLTAHQATQ